MVAISLLGVSTLAICAPRVSAAMWYTTEAPLYGRLGTITTAVYPATRGFEELASCVTMAGPSTVTGKVYSVLTVYSECAPHAPRGKTT